MKLFKKKKKGSISKRPNSTLKYHVDVHVSTGSSPKKSYYKHSK